MDILKKYPYFAEANVIILADLYVRKDHIFGRN